MGSNYLFSFLFFIFFQTGYTQNGWSCKHKYGFSYTNGSQLFLSADYDYKVNLFHIHYYRKLVAKKFWGLDLMLNPQFGVTEFKENPNSQLIERGQELGLNGGVLIHKNLIKDHLNLYCMLSAGPHYISGAPERQAGGFIFADNATVGCMVKIDPYCYLFLGGGIRHISNAKLKYPNGGINTTTIQAGLVLMVD